MNIIPIPRRPSTKIEIGYAIIGIFYNENILIDILNIGPPKQAANPIFGKPLRANETFDMRSPIPLPHESTDNPNKESLTLPTVPSADKIATTSVAHVDITQTDPINDPKTANALK